MKKQAPLRASTKRLHARPIRNSPHVLERRSSRPLCQEQSVRDGGWVVMWSGSCELQEANRWAHQPQRDEISLYGELELRNRFIQESQAKYCQEIEELRGICCEETDRARQARIDELSVRQERNPTTVSQLLAQIRDFQNEVNSASDAREFNDPESGSSSGATHAPSQFRVPGPCLTAILDCCRTHGVFTGTSGNVFERPPNKKDDPLHSSSIQRIWHRLLKN